MKKRRKMITELIRTEGEISIMQLREHFPDVSEMTLRRDLEYLDQNGQIVRIHGGAKSIEAIVGLTEELYSKRLLHNVEQKSFIAEKALTLLEPNTSVFIDSGTTTTALARIMPDSNLRIFTSGLTCALELARLKESTIELVGGELNKISLSTFGSHAMRQLENVNFDIAFLGVTGFTMKAGFTTGQFDDCELKRAAMKRAPKVVLLMDSSKIGRVKTYTFASLDDIDAVIVDDDIDQELVKEIKEKEVEVI